MWKARGCPHHKRRRQIDLLAASHRVSMCDAIEQNLNGAVAHIECWLNNSCNRRSKEFRARDLVKRGERDIVRCTQTSSIYAAERLQGYHSICGKERSRLSCVPQKALMARSFDLASIKGARQYKRFPHVDSARLQCAAIPA